MPAPDYTIIFTPASYKEGKLGSLDDSKPGSGFLSREQGLGDACYGAMPTRMRATPINDFMTRNGRIREDGRVIRDLYLPQVKTPAESHGEWDLAKAIATISGERPFVRFRKVSARWFTTDRRLA